jgi:3',5'-cyclic AMP phosphodiesterase CpdA
MSIMWLTNKKGVSWVEFGEGSHLNKKATSEHDGLIDAFNTINSVTLADLKPGTQYSYRVVSRETLPSKPNNLQLGEAIYSKTFSFTTPQRDPETVSFLMINDIHDRPESIPHLMKLGAQKPYDFVFFNGDVFNQQNDQQQIVDHMLLPATQVFASEKPFIMSRGNHETRGPFARDLGDYFMNRDERFYSAFEWGPVFFIVLDTGEDKEDNDKEYTGLVAFDDYRKKQAKWLESVMQTKAYKKAKYRVVLMHIPIYYSGDWHGTMHCRELFGPLFNKYKVDVTLSGHTHKYGFHEPVAGDHSYPIIIGGGPQDGRRTITRIEADAKALTIKMLRDDGVEVGNLAIPAKA